MATGHFVLLLEPLVTQGGQEPGQIIVVLRVILLVIRSWQLLYGRKLSFEDDTTRIAWSYFYKLSLHKLS